jgi:ribosome-binding protein aMBF1 (putative translation factor)
MNTIKCEICGKEIPSGEAIYYEAGDYFVCKECWEDEFVECDRCGAVVSRDDSYNTPWGTLCDCCHGDMCG